MESVISGVERRIPEEVEKDKKILKEHFGYKATVSNFMDLLKYLMGIDWSMHDSRTTHNFEFESFLIDHINEYRKTGIPNFKEVYDYLLEYTDFTREEQLLMEEGNVENKIWAIFLVLGNI